MPFGAVLAVVVFLSACGGGSHGNGEATKPASQVLSDVEQASAAASSARISGNVTSNGTQIQLQVVDGHNRGGGTIGVNGVTFQTVLSGQEVYLKADVVTWTKSVNASVAQLLANRWLEDDNRRPELQLIRHAVGHFTAGHELQGLGHGHKGGHHQGRRDFLSSPSNT